MICIKCASKSTSIINSRPHKRSPGTWRRRKCRTCDYTFSTNESVVFEDYIKVGKTPFSLPKLTVSLAPLLADEDESADIAYWLARTIGEQLLTSGKDTVTREVLLHTTHEVVTRYNPTAGMQYALRYKLIQATASPRRGRPKFTRP